MNTEPGPEAVIRKSTHDLGLRIAANLHKVGLTEGQEKFFLKHPELIVPATYHGFSEPEIFALEPETVNQIKGWESFYELVFGIKVQLLWKVKIQPRRQGFNRLIIVIKRLFLNQVYGVCAKHFICECYGDDLDASVTENDRDPNRDGTYAIWVKDTVEADENLKDLSTDALKEKEIKGVTLLERMLYELKYFRETGEHLDISRLERTLNALECFKATGKHLDIDNVTLCSGSRLSGGGVPRAYWRDGEFRVGWCSTVAAYSDLRAREVVAL